MRHKKKFNHLGRLHGHRKAMLSNMASSLIVHKRIKTTIAKAKALKIFVEPLITKAKEDTTHSRRHVFSNLQDKEATNELFRDIAVKVGDRPGGYTRIIKLGRRLGDNADMCIIELVDYNENMLAEKAASKTSRRRRGAKKKSEAEAGAPVVQEAVVEDQSEEPSTQAEGEVAEGEIQEEVTEEVEATPEAEMAEAAAAPEVKEEENQAEETKAEDEEKNNVVEDASEKENKKE